MSGFYDIGKEDLLSRAIPSEADIAVFGVNEDYVFNVSHTDSAIFEPHIILPETMLTDLTFSGGVLKAANPTWLAAGAGIVDRSLNLQGLVLLFKLGDSATLFAFIDSASAGLPQAVTGVNVTAIWNPLGILKL